MVYFIGNEDFVKIGVSEDIESRLVQIQITCPFKLKVHLLIDGSFALEGQLHKMFAKHYANGEWFKFSQEIKSYIASMEEQDLRWKFGLKPNDFVFPFSWARRKFTLQEIADVVGTTPSTVRQFFEREKKGGITINAAKKIANAMGYDFEYRLIKR